MSYFPAASADFPASAFPTPDLINRRRVLDFDDGSGTATELCYFSGYLTDTYGGGGLTIKVIFSAVPTSGAVVWEAAFERLNTDTSADSFDTGNAQTATTTVSGTANIRVVSSIAFTNGQIDGLLAGEEYRIYLKRLTSSGADTLVGDASLSGVSVYEP
jgi:hypothetical protein